MKKMYLEKSDNLIFREIDGDIVIISNDGRRIHMLNETASLIWNSADKETTILQIIGKMCDQYEVNKELATHDVMKTIKAMSEKNLIHVLREADSD
jgi:DNA integrity scanning protein DisA with diadenylate cyclase activity